MNKKQQLLIDTALTLFYRNGINSVGINEVLTASGVAKKTLYNHFSSKEALIIAALNQRHTNFVAWLKVTLSGADTNEKLVIQLFNGLERWFTNSEPRLGDFRGCFFVNSAAEFGDPDSSIAMFCQNHKQQVRALIAEHMAEDNPLLLDAICVMKEGAISTAYVSGDYASATKSIAVLNQLSGCRA